MEVYQAFMLQGKGSPSNTAPTNATNNYTPSPRHNQQNQYNRNAFDRVLVTEWLSIDDNLAQVVHSISHLQDRCRALSQELSQSHSQQHAWSSTRPTRTIAANLLHHALTKDLLEHERLLQGLRKLLSALQQGQEALGRRLDVDDNDCLVLYQATAAELYRKQVLAKELLDHATDDLVANDTNNRRRVAHKVANQWSRQHATSPLAPHAALLASIEQRQHNSR